MNDRAGAAERAAVAYRALGELAETIEDEWQYVSDLTEAYEPAILALGERPGPLQPGAAEAVDEAIAEIALIEDPHKAIDWLSTFPHVVALALGGDVDGAADDAPDGTGNEAQDGGPAGGRDGGPEPDADDDSPFRILRGDR
jgi:hypothetical protein